MCGLLTFGVGTASAAEPPDIAQLVAAMQQEGQNAAEKSAFTGGGYRASLARAAETAAQAAAAAPVSAPAQEDPGETGGDEEPSEPAPVTQHSIHDENGYYVHNGSAYNSITKDGLWVGGTDENTGFHVNSGGNVTTTGSITVNRTGGAGSVTIDASTGKITGLAEGEISDTSTDAVTGKQLNAVKKVAAELDGLAVKYTNENKTAVDLGSATLTTTGAVTAGSFAAGSVKVNDSTGHITGLTNTTWGREYTPVTGQAATEDQLAIVSGKADSASDTADAAKEEASKHTTVKAAADGHIKVEEGTNTAGGKEYTLSAEGLLDTDLTNITESGKTAITNIAKGADQHIEAEEYAVDKDGKVTLTYVDGNGKAIDGQTATITGIASAEAVTAAKTEVVGDSNVKVDSSEEADGHTKYTVGLADTVTLGESTGSHVTIDGTAGTITATGAVTAGSFVTTGDHAVTVGNGTITGLTNTTWNGTATSGQAATEDQLKAVADADKYVTGGSINSTDGTLTLNQAKTGTVTISGLSDYVASVNNYVTGGSIDTSSGDITLNRKLSGSVTISGLKDYVSGIDTYVTGAKIDGTKLTINKNHGDAVEVDLSGLADGLSTSDYHLVANPTGGNYKVKDGKVELTVQNGDDTADKQTVTIEGIASTDDVTNIKTNVEKLDKLAVKYTDENKTAVDLGSATLTTTGAITGGSFVVNGKTYISDAGLNANGSVITGVSDAKDDDDAVNLGQLNEKLAGLTTEGTKYKPGSGIKIDGDTISAKAKENGNIVVDENGISLAADVKDLTSVTASGAITAGSFAAGNVKINENSGGTITGLTNTEWTGTATNGRAATEDQLASVQSQIKNYTAGDGISISGEDNKISVNAGKGLGVDNGSLTVKGYEGITVGANGVSVNLASNSGLGFDRGGALYIMTPRGGNIEITGDGLDLADEVSGLTSVSAGQLTATNSLTAGNIIVDGKTYISSSGLNANGVITGVSAGTISATSTEAVNGSQLFEIKQVSDLAVTYTDDDKTQVKLAGDGGTTITNVKNGALNEDSTEAVNGRQLYAVDEKVGDATWSTSNLLDDAKNLTNAAQILDSKMGDVNFTGANLITNEKNLTDAAMELDSQIGNLTMHSEQAYFSVGYKTTVTGFLDELSKAIGPMTYRDSGAHYISSHGNVNSALLALDENLYRVDTDFDGMMTTVGFRKVGDEFTTTIDWSDSSYGEGTTIVTAIKNLDDRVLTLEGKNPAGESLSAFSKMSTANVSALSALSNMDTETAETLASLSTEDVQAMAAKAPAAAPAAPAPGDPTATSTRPGPDGESETGDTGDAYEVKQDLHVTGDTTLDGALTVDGAGTFNDGLTVNTKTEGGTALTVNGGASINGTLNMNGNKITGVADGEISETSTDAVNGSQLWGVQQDIENNASAIASLGGQVSRLDNRIDRVGAGAAALAALHPLDYDPEVKWGFAAGYGNYRGANAVSVGAFYRPNEDVMFSVGGSMGGGENMVNAGVSFKLGSGSGLTTSRTAMARELAAMKDTVAAQNAQIEAQAKQIEELTALVAQLAAEKAGAPEEKKA